MPGDFGLDFAQRVGHFADADFVFRHHQHQAAQPGRIGQGLEKTMGIGHSIF
jgi:hypothetical protein